MTNELVDTGASFSGLERNHLFLNQYGKTFLELSGLSGLDSLADARSNVRFDFDRDGYPDIGIVNANAPLLNLYRNQLGTSPNNHFLAIRLHGGNRTAAPSTQWSNRDGIAAQIRIHVGTEILLRETRAGEGFGGQNSRTLIVGLEKHPHADSVQIDWPSGRRQTIQDIPAGTLLDVFEDPSDPSLEGPSLEGPSSLDNGTPARRSPYRVPRLSGLAQRSPRERLPLQVNSKVRLSIYVTVATWCQSCQSELDRLRETLQRVAPGTVAAYGLPIDPEDTQQKLAVWRAQHAPPVPVLDVLTAEQRAEIQRILKARAALPQSVPNTIIADETGVVRAVLPGAPTLSQIRALLDS